MTGGGQVVPDMKCHLIDMPGVSLCQSPGQPVRKTLLGRTLVLSVCVGPGPSLMPEHCNAVVFYRSRSEAIISIFILIVHPQS